MPRDPIKTDKTYMCGCGSYITLKGKAKHEQTEKQLISTDIEPPIENIDGLPNMPLFLNSSARINHVGKPLTL